MPKIEVYTDTLLGYVGRKMNLDELEDLLSVAKAELDDVDESEGLLKIELNDTNRPDLWSTAGLARQLRSYVTASHESAKSYDFFSTAEKQLDPGERVVNVDPNIQPHRPYVAAFAVTGKPIDEPSLKDLIQTQEKLCWNFGQKRKSIAMGVYRNDLMKYPVSYRGADPDATKFVPLQENREMSLSQILTDHPKGQEYGWIVKDLPVYPFLEDANGDVLSFPPIINSARLGAVEVGDQDLFVEMTGTDIRSLVLAVSIAACDLADSGYTILPVKTVYPYDTEFGREVVTPYYFQTGVEFDRSAAHKMLGEELSDEEIGRALDRMGVPYAESGGVFSVSAPMYRNDFLHPVDAIEDVMIGHGTNEFEAILPAEFTVGRLSPEEEFGRSVKDLMVGMQYQEMIYNYLGSKRDFVDRMCIAGDDLVQIANPMTENYEYVRNSVFPALLATESVSAHAPYPHAMFEVGKIAHLDADDNQGSVTRNYLGFLDSDRAIGLNEVSARVRVLFYYLNLEYQSVEHDDPRFIPGRCAAIECGGTRVGIFGELHPQVLENWGIQMPCTACEVDLDDLLAIRNAP